MKIFIYSPLKILNTNRRNQFSESRCEDIAQAQEASQRLGSHSWIIKKPAMGDIRRLSPPGLKEDLPIVDDEQKNWKGILISLLVISTICSFIFLSIVLMTPHMMDGNLKEPLKIEDFLLEGYQMRHYNGSWISSKEILYKELNGSICIYNVENKHKELILDGALTVCIIIIVKIDFNFQILLASI